MPAFIFQSDLIGQSGIPDDFFEDAANENCSIFLITCHSNIKLQMMGAPCERITGYLSDEFDKGGMNFWFSLIHPEDLARVTEKIIAGHEELLTRNPQAISPVRLHYRLKRGDGEWVRLRDTRFLLSYGKKAVIDEILCKMEVRPFEETGDDPLESLLHEDRSCNHMLEVAVQHQAATRKTPNADPVQPKQQLTRREKEILQLIGNGLSTKMIAHTCKISINTVETHRRHLLEKLEVKNSMELIKEASKCSLL
ncbi:helix-turn-helix transcriptional regulator [Flavitalea flava]